MKIFDFLKSTFLFQGVSEDELSEIIDENPPVIKSYKRGELIYSSEEERLVGFVLSGKCEVCLDRCGGRTVLNILSESDSFGVLSVYSKEEFPTQIFAARNCEIICFSAEKIEYFVNNYSHISTNLIHFLVNRISFLNKKVATFSANTVEERLCAFLLCESDRLGVEHFPFNCQKTASEINAGRASVYRVLSSLEYSGFIKLVDKKITIYDRKGLERIVK